MKMIFILISTLFSFSLQARSDAAHFNRTLLEDVHKDVKNENKHFEKKPSRAPASIGATDNEVFIDHGKNLDKKNNINQLGRKEW